LDELVVGDPFCQPVFACVILAGTGFDERVGIIRVELQARERTSQFGRVTRTRKFDIIVVVVVIVVVSIAGRRRAESGAPPEAPAAAEAAMAEGVTVIETARWPCCDGEARPFVCC